MKKTIILTAILSAMALMLAACGDNTKVNISEGSGYLTYNGRNNPLKFCTMVTTGPDTAGEYLHVISIVSENTRTSFTASLRTDSKDVPTGQRTLKFNGKSTGTYQFESTNQIKGNAVGLLTITKNGKNNYSLRFSDTEAPLQLSYTGGLEQKSAK